MQKSSEDRQAWDNRFGTQELRRIRAKAGYFLPQVLNLGFEVSASHAKPDIEAQSTAVSEPIPGIGSFKRTSLRVVTVAFNMVARARMKGFEPYAGVGVGVFFAPLKNQTGASSSDNGCRDSMPWRAIAPS